jgi:tryptophan synthase alpha chain
VSPVSKQRVPEILKDARGFVYCVSAMGVTGQSGSFHREILNYLADVKAKSSIPVMMGFGITKAADLAPMKDSIDGAIVGSHFINLLREHNFSAEAAADYCSTFKKELKAL